MHEDRPNLISNGSCVSIVVRLKGPRASVLTCPFQIQRVFSKRMNCFLQPVSARRLESSEGKAGGHKGW